MASKLKKMCFNLPQQEIDKLNAYAESMAMTKTDVLREFIRNLPDPPKSTEGGNKPTEED